MPVRVKDVSPSSPPSSSLSPPPDWVLTNGGRRHDNDDDYDNVINDEDESDTAPLVRNNAAKTDAADAAISGVKCHVIETSLPLPDWTPKRRRKMIDIVEKYASLSRAKAKKFGIQSKVACSLGWDWTITISKFE